MNHSRRLLKTFQLMLWRMSLAVVLVAIFTSVISYTREGAGDDRVKVQAATSSNLNYQARLLNSSGNLVADGYYNIQFKLYNADTGGSALWTETYYDSNGVTAGNDNRVRVVNGYMSVNLGSQTAFPALDWDQDMWLTINVGGTTQTATPTWDGEMSPRIKMTSVPYAFQAGSSRTLNQNQGTYTGTLDFDTLTDNRSFLLPDSSLATTGSPATVCVFNGSTTNCPTAGGSGNYIQNTGGSASPQTAANFNIQATNSSTNGTIGGIIRGAAGGQTVDLLQLQSSAGAILTAFQADGKLVFGPSGSQDTNLYRSGANTLRTDDALSVGSTLAVTGNSTLTGTLTVNNTTDINVSSTTALQVRNGGTSTLTVNTTAGQVGIGGPAANSVLTVGTNTTAASGGITFGTDTNLYRSAANTLRTDDSLVVPGLGSVSVATVTNTSYNMSSTAAGSYLAYSPVPKYLWHDLLAFNRWWGTPSFETYNGSWSAGTLDSNLFSQKESYSTTVVNGTSVTGARWTWNSGNAAYAYPNWWALGFSYNGATASSKNILIESSADGSTWTTRHTSTGNTANAVPVWLYMTDNASDTYIRLTISVTNSQPLTMASIKALSARWGNQGGGSEYELPYDWDNARRITIGTTSGARSNGVLNLGGTAPTTAAEGIYFGTDVSLYRSAANILATDDSLSLLGTSSNLTVQGTGTSTIAGNLTVSGTVTTGTTLNVGGTSNQRVTIASGAGNHGIEIGRTDGTSSTPYIDFHAGTTATDYDVRMIVSNGTGTQGAGTLTLQAGLVNLTGDLDVAGGDITSSAATFNLLNTSVTTLNIGGAVGAGGINLAGGSGSTGCTIDGSTGNLSCTGTVTGGGSTGTQGWWSRSGTILQPANTGDSVTTSGDIYTTSTGTITSAGLLTASGGLQVTNAGGKTTLELTSTGSNTGLTIGADTNLYRSSANNLATDDSLAVGGAFSSTGSATVGNGTTSVNLTIQGSSYNGVVTNIYSDTASAYSFFQRARGTQASPTYVTNNSFLGSFGFRGHNGTSFLNQDSARISAFATQDFTGGTHGGAIAFYTAANGTAEASGSSERFRIDHNGNVRIGSSATISSKLTFDAATTAAGGILFGSDTNLYRSGANTLATDDSLTLLGTGSNLTVQGTGTSSIAGNLTVSGTAAVQGSGGLTIGVAGSVTGNLNLANSTSSRLVVLQGLNPSGTGNATIQIPSIAGGSTDTVCLVTLANCTGGGGSGVDTIGTIDSQTKSANGAVISGTTLYLQTADATSVGLVSAGTQTFGGNKTFNGTLTAAGGIDVTGAATINTTGTATTSIGNSTGALTLTGSSGSSIIFGGTTVSASELNLLDGKNTTLVDADDAINTAITGTGVLTSGSIGSGFGTIATSNTISGTQLISTVSTGTAPLQVASTTMVSNLNANYLGGYTNDQLNAFSRSEHMMSGGGTVAWTSGSGISWSQRFIVISNSRGSSFSTNGYFDITMPANGTVITGANTSNVTVGSGLINLSSWCALYYILPIGSNNVSQSSNFRIVCYSGTDFSVPSTWVLIASHNNDNATMRFGNGIVLRSGQSATAGTVNNIIFNTSVTTPLLQSSSTLNVTATGANPINFNTNGSLRWSVLSGGELEGNGASTIRSSTGDLTLATNGGNGNIILSPNGTGTITLNGATSVQNSGGLTVGVAGSVTGNINLANSTSSRLVVLQGLNPSGTGNATVQVPSIAGGSTDTVCLQTLANCSGGGVTSLNGQTGSVTISNASGSAGTITIQDASTTQKGIAQFNSTNFTAASGTINTVQNINTSASPTFANVNATTSLQLNGTSINTAGTLTNVAYLSQNQTFAGVNTFRNTSDSTAAFRIQNSAASIDLLTADTTNGVIKIGTTGTATQSGSALFVTTAEFSGALRVGDGTNRVQFDGTTKKIEYVGTARQDKRVTLDPEYPGAVLTADGSNNVGTMTSDFCSNTGTLSINNSICGSGEAFNYYSWMGSGGTMDYDIYVRWQAPSDFSAFSNATDAVKMYGWRTSSSEKVELSMYQANGTQCGSTTEINSSNGAWQQTSMTGDETGCTVAANDVITFRIKLTASSTGFARASNIQINYLSKF